VRGGWGPDRGLPSRRLPLPGGNYKSLRRALLLKRMLRAYGIDERRLRLEWISASEGEKYARVSLEMEEEIRRLGPLRLGE